MQPSVTEMTFPTAGQCSAAFQHLQLLRASAAAAPCMSGGSCHMLLVSWQLPLKCQLANSCYCHCCKLGLWVQQGQQAEWCLNGSCPWALQAALPRLGNWGRLEHLKQGMVFHALQSQGSHTGSSLDRGESGAVSLLLKQLGRISDPSLQLLTAPAESLVSATVLKWLDPLSISDQQQWAADEQKGVQEGGKQEHTFSFCSQSHHCLPHCLPWV